MVDSDHLLLLSHLSLGPYPACLNSSCWEKDNNTRLVILGLDGVRRLQDLSLSLVDTWSVSISSLRISCGCEGWVFHFDAISHYLDNVVFLFHSG